MCGIAGIINNGHQGNFSIDEPVLRGMAEVLSHRGPDDAGVYISKRKSVGLAHRRLSIIDITEAGHQPMSNEDGTVWIAYNGEIYNFKKLREELERKGHRFRSRTDTEVIIHLYEEEGVNCVKRLDGMFAFAIWDEKKKQLFLARDRVGQKPLFYFKKGPLFFFASEIKAILKAAPYMPEMDEFSLHQYLTYGYVFSPDTFFRNIQKLPPGHILVYKGEDLKIERYWRLRYSPKLRISREEGKVGINEHLRRAVQARMVSDVPLGAFLSGGIDSSLIVALMSEFSDRPVKTFSIGFEEADYNELEYARLAAKRFKTEHKEFIVQPDLFGILPELVRHYNEPFGDSSCIPSYYVAKMTGEYVTVALNGDGGDESFGGYERYIGAKFSAYFDFLPPGVLRLAAGITRLAGGLLKLNKRELARRENFWKAMIEYDSYETRYARWISCFTNSQKEELYSDRFKKKVKRNDSFEMLAELIRGSDGADVVDRVMNADVLSYLPEDLLVKIDIATMANSLEARSPFLDHHLMEFAASLPSSWKIKGMRTKSILKDTFASLLPEEILKRKKMGFGIPIGVWFKGKLRPYLEDALLGGSLEERGYFNMDYIRRLLKEHTVGSTDHTHRLWMLLNFELWCRIFI